MGQRAGNTLEEPTAEPTQTEIVFMLTITQMVTFIITSYPSIYLFGLWKKASVPREGPCKQGEHMQTLHKKPSNQEAGTSFCEATMLNTGRDKEPLR